MHPQLFGPSADAEQPTKVQRAQSKRHTKTVSAQGWAAQWDSLPMRSWEIVPRLIAAPPRVADTPEPCTTTNAISHPTEAHPQTPVNTRLSLLSTRTQKSRRSSEPWCMAAREQHHYAKQSTLRCHRTGHANIVVLMSNRPKAPCLGRAVLLLNSAFEFSGTRYQAAGR